MRTYVLECSNSCYYVGKTSSINRRMQQHWGGKGAKWTQAHKPVRILEIFEGDVERQQTLLYMARFGPEKVRGGPWCKVARLNLRVPVVIGDKTNPPTMALTAMNLEAIKSWAIGDPQINAHGGKTWSIQSVAGAKSHPKLQLGGDALSLRSPFGIAQFSPESRHTLDFAVPDFVPEQAFLKAIDQWVVDQVFANQDQFWPKQNKPLSREALLAQYTPLLSQKGDYEPLMRAKINTEKVLIYKVLDGMGTTTGTVADVTAGSQCVPVLSLSKLWVMGTRFGVSSWVEALMVWPAKPREMAEIFNTNLCPVAA